MTINVTSFIEGGNIVIERAIRDGGHILITSETGSKVFQLVREMHQESPQSNKPLLQIDLRDVPQDLAESKIFGHERGAFTGAIAREIGLMERAESGILLFQEIQEAPLPLQERIANALQAGEISRVGGQYPIPIAGLRVIASTSCDLRAAIAAGTFSAELYRLLTANGLYVTPLRNRKELIPCMVSQQLEALGVGGLQFTESALDMLRQDEWPGNLVAFETAVLNAATDALFFDETGPRRVDVRHIATAMTMQTGPVPDEAKRLFIASEVDQAGDFNAALHKIGASRRMFERVEKFK